MEPTNQEFFNFEKIKEKIKFFWEQFSKLVISKKSQLERVLLFLLGAIVALFLFHAFYLSAPDNFPSRAVVSVKDGESLTEIADSLKKDGVIKSPFWFKNFVILLGGEKKVIAGDYFFEKSLSVWEVTKRVTRGVYSLKTLKVFIPEGSTIFDTASIIKKEIPNFDDIRFLKIARDKEGYLFPDTYFFMPNISPEEVVRIMGENFTGKIGSIQDEIKKSKRKTGDVIIMASILEKEARTSESRKVVAGILWKRLDSGMPLQVDASFGYINGVNVSELTPENLKINSPYNTYKYKGLPPTPICNPGLNAIEAALTPSKTKYYFYLSDSKGDMHYSADYAGHQKNIEIYLR